MKVRTRYAPSPTGYFHIGGARTALFNYLFAKHYDGEFIVRIEDTDTERNVENGAESQLENISWMQFEPDESLLKPGRYGPYLQTQKLKRYEELANKLLLEKKAYRCFCSKHELEEQRKIAEANHQTPKYNRRCLYLSDLEIQDKINKGYEYVIRLKIDDKRDYEWNDLIRGKISINGDALTDPVILKSNKIAMYNFAVVIDDYDMDISHVLRGEEHISNTPYQIAIKEALGFNNKDIKYGHLSIIVNDQGKKLSKRDTTLKQFISDYREMGYLPQAIDNFLCLLGWTPSDNKELMNLNEMIAKFDLNDVSKSPAKFDVDKMNWVSNNHFKLMDIDEYYKFVKPFVKSKNIIYKKHEKDVLLLLKPQISYAMQIDDLIEDLFGVKSKIDSETKKEVIELIDYIKLIKPLLIKYLKSKNLKSEQEAKDLINYIKTETALKGKELFMSIRILCTGQMHGPELAKTLFLLGNDNILKNVELIEKEIF